MTPHFCLCHIILIMMTSSDNNNSPDNPLFYAFCILLVWLPLPLGSNRAWAWSVLEIWIFVLSAGWLVQFILRNVHVSEVVCKSRLPVYLLGFVVLWIGTQVCEYHQWRASDDIVEIFLEYTIAAHSGELTMKINR